MTGLPKRTSLRTSPEDAAHYKRYHQYLLTALRNGGNPETLQKELLSKGVPEKTAERILQAVGQEYRWSVEPRGRMTSRQWWVAIAAAVLIFGGDVGYVWREMSRDGTLSWGALLPALVALLIATAIVIARVLLKVRTPYDLPPPK